MKKNNLQEATDKHYNPCLQQETIKVFCIGIFISI